MALRDLCHDPAGLYDSGSCVRKHRTNVVTFWRVSAVLGESDVAYLLRFAGMALLGAGKSVRARPSCGRLLSLKS